MSGRNQHGIKRRLNGLDAITVRFLNAIIRSGINIGRIRRSSASQSTSAVARFDGAMVAKSRIELC
jgi:hypothetical protein